jgi:hypothetical protein
VLTPSNRLSNARIDQKLSMLLRRDSVESFESLGEEKSGDSFVGIFVTLVFPEA